MEKNNLVKVKFLKTNVRGSWKKDEEKEVKLKDALLWEKDGTLKIIKEKKSIKSKKVPKKKPEPKKLTDEEVMVKVKEIAKLDMPLQINKALKKLRDICDYDLPTLSKQFNNARKTLKKESDTSDTSVTGVTPITSVTPKLPVTPVTCNTSFLNAVFGNSNLEQIMRILVVEKRPLTFGELALKTGKSEVNIRNIISRNKEFFGIIGQKGKKCYTYLLHLANAEIQLKINQIKSKKAQELKEEEVRRKAQEIENNYENEIKHFINETKPERKGKQIFIDFNELSKHNPGLADSFLDKPKRFLDFITKYYDSLLDVQLLNLPQSLVLNIEQLRKKHLDKIICVEGRVTSFGSVKPIIIKTRFECPSCGTILTLNQNYRTKIMKYPIRCSCGRSSGFHLIEKVKANACFLQLEDLQDRTDNPHSQRVKSVLFNELCEPNNIKIFTPGNEVKCIGILKEVPIKNTVYEDFIFEITGAELIEKDVDLLNLSDEEIENINSLSFKVDEEGIEYLYDSFAPDIYGYGEIKGAIILQLCNRRNEKKKSTVRNKSNILLIGDPGIAKSVLGDFALRVSGGSRKAVGGGSSAVGITASVIKEEDALGGYRVEPGAMILAKDLLFIDELNNLSDEDKPKLQEGMNEQTISINKANIHVQMKVTAGIIAAANPFHGHFKDDSKLSIQEQFNIPSPILNRFDSIFVMRDNVNEDSDKLIAEKMLKRHRGKLNTKYSVEFLKKFFAYIKNCDEPEINDEIQKVFQEVYFRARKTYNVGVKINPRFLESLTRMSISSAKLRQSDKIEIKDINVSLRILASTQYKINETLIVEIDKK